MKFGQNWPKIESSPSGRNFALEMYRSIQNDKKITIFSENFVISDIFDEKQ